MADSTSGESTNLSAPGAPVTFFKKRGGKANLRKRPPTPPPATNDAASDSDSDDYWSGEEGGGNTALPAKRRKKQHVISSSSSLKPAEGAGQVVTQVTYAGDTSKNITKSEDATKRSNWHNETEEEYLIRKRGGDLAKAAAEKVDGKLDEAYQGAAGYKSFIRKKEDAAPSSKGKMGPVKAPTNVRQVVTVDFAPDVCKDYKQTGFCGFGDTCKFLHAREDYKQGWQLDNEWDNSKSGKKSVAKAAADEDSEPELKDIPFACVICKQEYKFPIVTKCNHYFCEKCALQRYRKNPGCAICGAGTNGIFNSAKNLQKKLDRKRARMAAKKEEEGEDEGEGSDNEVPQTSGFGAGIEIEGN